MTQNITTQNNMEIQEVLNPEVVNYINTKEKQETFKMFRGLFNYALFLFAGFFFFVTGYKLDGTNSYVKTTTEHVLNGTYDNVYTDEKYNDLILINDTVGVSDEVLEEIKLTVAYELYYFSDEFIDEFLQNTKFEIEIRDTYCYSSGFGRNAFLHGLDKYNLSNFDGYVRAYYEGSQGILRTHAYMQEEDFTTNLKDSIHHELGHYFDTADFRYSSSDEFMELWDKYSKEEYMVLRTTKDLRTSDYPLSAPEELFAEMFAQYVKYPMTLEEYYPDLFQYYMNLLEK